MFLAQETISAHIASDPVEYYVFSGETMKFSMRFLRRVLC